MPDSDSIYRSVFYSDSIGIFQGGGCRAAAFGGAYAAAYEHGVRLTEVAGTSAGSIVAALVAAGAEPDFLLRKLRELDFRSLLVNPTRSSFARKPAFLSVLGRLHVLGPRFQPLIDAAQFGGIYSSEGVERWVEGCLRELTGKRTGPVEFQDLVMPLYVVAGDLGSMKARVWNSEQNPRSSVAHAVRASCTIPLFFQPVEEGSALLVDGGLISNLPHFLFSSKSSSKQKSRKRLLLFMLEATEERQRPADFLELLSQLATLAVDGATDLQLSFAPDIARIIIPTGHIQATDFDKMNDENVQWLIDSGRAAGETFMRRELLNVRGSSPATRVINDEHEVYLAVTEQLYSVQSEVKIASADTKWFWELFPTLLHWRKTAVRVSAFSPPVLGNSPEHAKELQRRELMAGMGVDLINTAELPFQGYLFDPVVNPGACGLTLISARSDYEPVARFYTQRLDNAALTALHGLLPVRNPDAELSAQPRLERMDEADLLSKLRENVQVYRHPGVSLAVEEIVISRVQLISRYVRAFRYTQIGSLIDAYREVGLELFEPAQVSLIGGDRSIVTPPVVEESGDALVALEGNTRFLYCYNHGIDRIKAVVVRGVRAELPGRPVSLRQVRITSLKHPPEGRIEGFNFGLFRPIERAVRPINEGERDV